jgi:hypothetical protein
LIETERQRRWWFATHPEFSWSRTGNSGDVSGRFERGPIENPAKEAFIRQMAKAGWRREKAEERWKVHRLNENIAQGVADAMAVVGALGTARAVLTRTYRWAVGLGQAGAIGKTGGPGKWVGMPRRGGPSLEHQSKMSGKPIIIRDGKYYIEEYEIGDVHYDDYRNKLLWEYKGYHQHLFDKNDQMMPWVTRPDQFRDEAIRQVDAAKGIPVIWRVGSDQVKFFRNAIGNVPGVTVKP